MLSRRQFLKIGAAATTAAAASSFYSKMTGRGPSLEAASIGHRTPDKSVATFCEICFWKCGMIADVADGKVVQMHGNPEHPLSNGKLCPRGMSAPGIVHDPDRLKKPLIREVDQKSGEQKFREVEWEEALDYTAKRLQQIADEHGPEKIALFSHGHGGSFFETLLEGLGSKTETHPSNAQCRGPRDAGFFLTYGAGVGNPELIDVPNSKAIVLIGSHLGENMHNTAVQDISNAIGNGATIITVDPRFSTIAGKSEYWLPIKPGTDIALLLAWMHVLINEEIYNRDFIAKNATGFEELKAHVADKTPEWAYIITGIQPDVIRKTARIIAKNAPRALVHPGRHVVWYGDDTQRSRAIAIVNALLGNWGKEGGFYYPVKYPIRSPEHPHPKKAKSFSYPPQLTYPLSGSAPSQVVVECSKPEVEGIKKGEHIRAWIAYGCNIPMTMPDTESVNEAMDNLDFFLAVDILPAEVTGYADVVFPESTFLERFDDLDARSYREEFVAIRQPVIEPLYDSKPGWWMVKELAKRLKDPDGNSVEKYFPWKDAEELAREKAELSGIDFEELKKKGVVRGKKSPLYNNSDRISFGTPSGKVELYSKQLASMGFQPMPVLTLPEEPPEGFFRLLFGRTPVHTFSRTTNNAQSLEIYPENEVWLNRKMGKVLNLQDGVYVTLENQDAVVSNKIKVKLTEQIRQDCVFIVHGFGRFDERLTKGYQKGAADSLLISRYKTDPIQGGTGMNVNFVKLKRAL